MAENPITELGEVIQSYKAGTFDSLRAQRAINKAISTPGLTNCYETISIVRTLMSKHREKVASVDYPTARRAFETEDED